MRILSLSLLGMTCIMTGQYLSYSVSARVKRLEKIIHMLEIIQNNFLYLNLTVQEMIKNLANRNELKKFEFIKSCDIFMNNGMDFPNAWEASVTKEKFITKNDKENLLSFGLSFGTSNIDGQLQNCKAHIELFKNNLISAKNNKEKNSPLFSGIGILTGIAVVIVGV